MPAWAHPGAEVWARGYHAGRHAWFHARVLKLRATYPCIVVRYVSDADGNTHRHALPELDAYLGADAVREQDW